MAEDPRVLIDWMSLHRGHGRHYTTHEVDGVTYIQCACGWKINAGHIRTMSAEAIRSFNQWLASPSAGEIGRPEEWSIGFRF